MNSSQSMPGNDGRGAEERGSRGRSPSRRADAVNPFVPMPQWAIASVLIFGAFYTLLVCSVALLKATEGGISMLAVAVSNVWLIFCVLCPLIFYKPTYGWCHPLILLALLGMANMVPRSTSLLMNGLAEHVMLSDWSSSDLNMLFAYGNLVLSLALVATYAGFRMGPRLPVPKFYLPSDPPQRFYLVLLIFLGISLTAFGFYAEAYGGLANQLKSLAFGMAKKIELAEELEGIGQYTVVMGMAPVAAVLWVCAQPNAVRNPIFWVLTASALVLAYVSEGKRSQMIYPAILIMLCWMLRNRKVPYLHLALAGVAAFFLLGFLGQFRISNWSDTENLNLRFFQETSLAELGSGSLEELARRSGPDSTYYAILAKVPHEEELLYGRTYLEWTLRFIPREFWPDKPRGVDVQANQTFYGADWGLPPGAVGEAYWNFHVLGVMVIFFLLGVLKRWLADLLIAYPRAPAVMAIYIMSLFHFDASQNGFRAWLYAMIPALLMLALGGLLGGSRSTQLHSNRGLGMAREDARPPVGADRLKGIATCPRAP